MCANLAEPLPVPTPADAIAGDDAMALFILGTPGGGWRPLADAVWQALGRAGRAPHGGVVDGAGTTALAAVHPGARFLVWVEHPARMLARRFGDPSQSPIGAEDALAEWREAARRLLTLAYRGPAHCLLVVAQEAVASPSALVRALARWDERFAGLAAPEFTPEVADPLHEALAIAAVGADGQTQRLFEELHAACIAVHDDDASEGQDDVAVAAPPLRVDAARQSISELRAEASRLTAEVGAARIAAEQAGRADEARITALRGERDAARQESELLQAQLHQVQRELETVFLQQQDTESKLADAGIAAAEQASRLKASDARILQALAERDAQARLAETRRAALEEAESLRRPLVEQLAAATQATAAAGQARDLAAQQAQALQRELDDAVSQRAALQSRLAEQDARLKALEQAESKARRDAEAKAAADSNQLAQLAEQVQRAEEQARADLARQAADAQQQLDAARQESDLLLAQLQQVQEKIEAVFLQQRDTERKLAEERRAATERAEAQRRTLQEQVAAATQAAAAAEQARDLSAQQTQALRRELDEAVSQRAALQSQVAQLQAQQDARLKALEQAESKARRDAEAWAAAEVARQAQHARLAEQVQQAEQARADLARQAADAQQQLDSARKESDLVLAQLHQLEEELEAIFVRAQEQSATASSRITELEQRLADDHAVAERARQSMQQQLAQVLSGAERNQERQLLLDRQRNAELAELRETLAAARQQTQLTGRQMGLMQQALEADEVIPRSPRLQPPHLELEFTLRGVRLFGQEIDALDARLVEHHGHPGLALLDGPVPGAGLRAFAEHGRDGDRPYMLLVPADAPARQTLALLGTHDWMMVRGIVAALERALSQRGDFEAARWRQVARRLQAELDDLPPRLRYDRLEVDPDPVAPGAFRVRFGHALFGARYHEQIALRWHPSPTPGGAAPLALLAPTAGDESPPLAAWPPGDQGGWAAEWALPLGGALEPAARRAAWRSLPAADHALVLALLDALPAAVHLLAAEGRLPAGLQRDALVAGVSRWVAEAEDVEDPANRLLRMARRLRGGRRGATTA